MSFNICAISGTICEHPVVSKNSGYVFEKNTIEKYIEATGRCPITNLELKHQDLLEVKADNFIKPRNVNNTSMPGLFTELQNEWESIIQDTYTTKKQLEIARQELSHTLYQQDASVRVICTLLKERDFIRDQLTNYQNNINDVEDVDEEGFIGDEVENMGIPKVLSDRITELSFKLMSDRKKREIPAEMSTFEEISKYKCMKTFYPFKNDKSEDTSITTIDLHKINPNFLILGCANGRNAFCSLEENDLKVLHSNNISKKSINDIAFYPSENIIGYAFGSSDAIGYFILRNNINDNTSFTERYRINTHSETITGLSFHPLSEYALFSSLDGHWSFHNLLKGVCLTKEYTGSEINSIRFHPDGSIFATGHNNGLIKLWDITTQQSFKQLEDNSITSDIQSISFSENGYYMASCGYEDSVATIWDIRKENRVFKSIQLNQNETVNKLEFDFSGNILSLAGTKLWIYDMKTNTLSDSLTQHTGTSTSFKYEHMNTFVVSSANTGEVMIHK